MASLDGSGEAITVTQNAKMLLNAGLTNVDGVSITVDGTGEIPLNQFTSLADGVVNAEGGSSTFSNLTELDGSNVEVSGGAVVTCPVLSSYSNASFPLPNTLESTGAGSTLSLPALTSLEMATVQGSFDTLNIQGIQGGQILMPILASVTNTDCPLKIEADGAGSTIDLSGLTGYDDVYSGIGVGSLTVTDHGTVDLNRKLTDPVGLSVTLDGTGNVATSQWTSLTGGGINITGGSYTFSNLTNIDESGLSVENGGSLTLPALTSYSNTSIKFRAFQASGTGSRLSLPALTAINATLEDGLLSATAGRHPRFEQTGEPFEHATARNH